MASSYFSASTVSSAAMSPDATGAEAYEGLTAALGGFKEDSDNTLARLEQKTRGLGEKAAAAAITMADHDAGLAAAYQGG